MLPERLQQAIYEIIRYAEVINQSYMEPHEVTVAQGYTLIAFPPSTPISMSALSDKLGLANSTVTRMVDQLVQKKLVGRAAHPEDRRVVQVVLTPNGQTLQATLKADFFEFFAKVLDRFPSEAQPTLVDHLEAITREIIFVMENKHKPEGEE